MASGVWAFFFEVPTWAKRAGCTVASEALGTSYDAARARAEEVLLPALDSWRTNGASDISAARRPVGTLDWIFSIYRQSRKFTKLDRSTRRTHELGFGLVGSFMLKDGRRIGIAPLAKIDSAAVDRLSST